MPVMSFHISGRHEIGRKFPTSLPFAVSFWPSTVLPFVIQSGILYVVVNDIVHLSCYPVM